MTNKLSLLPDSSEWKYVEFRLQLILSQPNVNISCIYKNRVKFDSEFDDHLLMDAAVDATSFDY
jgi:hypothetical protein